MISRPRGGGQKLLIGPVAAFEVEAPGGKRKVFYLHHDVIRWLEQLQEAAHAEGYRLTQSAIIEQLVRRHWDRG